MREPLRGFEASEYEARLMRAQKALQEAGLSALFLTTEPEIRYFTGFLTRFWESPTRPWYLIVPVTGQPVAVFPSIGAHLIGQSWIDDIRTWQSPNYHDDGLSLLTATLCELVPEGGRIGTPYGIESHLRMPLAHWEALGMEIGKRDLGSDQGIMQRLRLVKSDAEIAKIRQACAIADRAFDRVPEIAGEGVPLADIFRRFQILCLDEGADWVPYLAGASDHGGYGDVISPATPAPLQKGDILMLDTGLVWDGYFADFDRNFSIGLPEPDVANAYERLILAGQKGFEMAQIGATAADLFQAMNSALGDAGGIEAGRMGHGLGMQLTEWPSLIADDHTVLEDGMVLTLEPSIELGDGKIIVHEENIIIRAAGPEYLSRPASTILPVI